LPRLCTLLRLRTAPGRGWALLLDLPSHGFTRLIAVVLGPDRSLLRYRARVACSGILSLVVRQGCRRRDRIPVPLVPSVVLRRPALPPTIAPARRRVGAPATEIRRRLAVITHRDAQHEQWHVFGIHFLPGAVVPSARIPIVAL